MANACHATTDRAKGRRALLAYLALAIALGAIVGLTACSSGTDTTGATTSAATTASDAYHKIDAETAKKMIDAGGVTIVDVRRADEYASGHLPGAINVPNESIASAQPADLPDTSATLVVYCRTGVRSKQASDKLVAMGYEAVYDMGGITSWPYETTTD
jgi:rhodanese-related sulfurtransferase